MAVAKIDVKTDLHGSPKDLDSTSKSLQGMSDQAEKSGKSIDAMGDKMKKAGKIMTVAGAAIVGGIGLMVKSYVEAGDEIDKMSKRTGLSATALSELGFAAEISGATLADVEKGIKRMASAIIDAEDGLMETKRAFDKLQLSTKKIIDMKPEDQFREIAKAIAKIESPTKRAALAQDIFGRAGTKLLPLFAEGEKGLEALSKEAHKLGIVFDKEAAAKAAKLKDEQTKLTGSIKGVSFALAETIIPMLTKTVTKIKDVIAKVSGWMKENPKLTGTIVKIAGAMGALMLVLGPLLIALPGIIAAVPLMGAAFSAMLGPIGLAIAAIAAITAVVLGFIKRGKEMRSEIKKLGETEAEMQASLNRVAEEAGLTAAEFEKLSEKYNDNEKRLARRIIKGKEGVELQEAMKKVTQENVEVATAAATALDAETKATEGLTGGIETGLKPAMKSVSTLHGTLVDEIKKATLDEHDYRIEQAKDVYEKRKEQLKNEDASKEDFVLLDEAHNLALKKIEDDRTAEMKTATEKRRADNEEKAGKIKQMWVDYWDAVKKKETEYKDFTKGVKDIIDGYTLDEFELKEKESQEWYEAALKNLEDNYLDVAGYAEAKELIEKGYSLKRKEIEESRAAKQLEIEEGELTKSKALMDEKLKYWNKLAEDMGAAFGTFTTNLLDKNTTLKDDLANLWDGIKQSFKNMIGDMVKEYVTNFVKSIITNSIPANKAMEGTTKTFEATGKAVAGIGEGIGKLIEGLAVGIGKAIEALATSIANAARSLAAAAPQLLVVGAVALALFAGFKAIEALFGGGGGGGKSDAIATDIRNQLQKINNDFDGAVKPVLLGDQQGRLDNLIQKADWTLGATEGILGYVTASKDYLSEIVDYTYKTWKELEKIPKSAKGGFFDKPTLTWVGEAGPEYIIPADKINRIGGGGSQGVQINISGPLIQTSGNVSPGNIKQATRTLIKEIEERARQGRFSPDISSLKMATT